MTNAELIKDARIIADSIHVHSSFQDWEAAEKDTLEKCADALEAAEKRIAELERILKAVQENSGINFRLWKEAEARMQTVTNCHTLEEGEQHGES